MVDGAVAPPVAGVVVDGVAPVAGVLDGQTPPGMSGIDCIVEGCVLGAPTGNDGVTYKSTFC